MKKFLFLLLIPTLMLAYDASSQIYPKSSTNTTGYVELKSSKYSPDKPCAAILFVHGNGGRGSGDQSALESLQATQIPSNLKAAIERYNIVVVAPQYANPGSNAVIDHAYNKLLSIPGVDPKRIGIADFSMGGGEVTRYITTSLENAEKFSFVFSIAGLNQLLSGGIKYIVQAKLPCLFFHANNDNQAAPSNSVNAVAAINALNPAIPAKGVYYTDGGHDITNRVFDADRFPFTGNEIPNNVYEYALALKNDSPFVVPTTAGPVLPVPVADDITTTSNLVDLIGSKSRNADPAKSKWSCVAVPAGVNIWNVNACGYINCYKVSLPAEGKYIFRLTVADAAGQTATKDITVTYSKSGTPTEPQEPEQPVPPVKVIVGRFFYGGWELVIYSDGSTDKK